MAALKDIARDFAAEIRDGIGWTIVYRTGRSWNAMTIWSDIWNGEWETDDLNDAIGILKADPDAVIVNGYYCGHFGEGMTIDEIAAGIRWHYEGGPNAFLTTELDLTTDDGLKDYGTCTVTIFLLTVDQYRRNRDVIPNADDWWWLSTAFSTKSNGYESLARLVCSDGALTGTAPASASTACAPLVIWTLISVEDDEATEDVTPEHAGEIIAALAEQFGGTFATEDQLTTALSFMLGTLRATREKEAHHE